MTNCDDERILQRVRDAARLWLFLDYDGTLADFAETPDHIIPDRKLIGLIERLAGQDDIRVTIISGRRLAHIQNLVPVVKALKAGTYGLEISAPGEELVHRIEYEAVRPLLDELKDLWSRLLLERSGFYLEDKGWTIAIHGKDAAEEEVEVVLTAASEEAQALLDRSPGAVFRLQGGDRFLEFSPRMADKKLAVEHIRTKYPWYEDALPVYLGDDDKDEIAFEAIQAVGGLVVAVGDRLRHSAADCWLPSPEAARNWLRRLLDARS